MPTARPIGPTMNARAVDHAAQDVAAELVGAEPVRVVGRPKATVEVLVVGRVGGEPGRQSGDQHKRGHDHEPHDGERVPRESGEAQVGPREPRLGAGGRRLGEEPGAHAGDRHRARGSKKV